MSVKQLSKGGLVLAALLTVLAGCARDTAAPAASPMTGAQADCMRMGAIWVPTPAPGYCAPR